MPLTRRPSMGEKIVLAWPAPAQDPLTLEQTANILGDAFLPFRCEVLLWDLRRGLTARVFLPNGESFPFSFACGDACRADRLLRSIKKLREHVSERGVELDRWTFRVGPQDGRDVAPRTELSSAEPH